MTITFGFTRSHDLLARFSPQRTWKKNLGGAPAVLGVTKFYFIFCGMGHFFWLVFAVQK